MLGKVSNNCPVCSFGAAVLIGRRRYRDQDWFLARCSSCGLHYTYPQPTPDQIRSFYSGDYHDELRSEGSTEAAFLPKMLSYRDWLLQHMSPGRSLDIGCATGLFPKLLGEAGFSAEGLEMNEASAEWGKTHYGVTIHIGSLAEVRLPQRHYDLVTLTDVLEHMANPIAFLAGVSEYLAPNGKVFVTFPDIASIESRYYHFLSRLFRRDWLWYRNLDVPLHIWEFTARTARATFRRAGFRVLAFRREQPEENCDFRLKRVWEVVNWPRYLLQFRPFGRYFGTQMQFLLTVDPDRPAVT